MKNKKRIFLCATLIVSLLFVVMMFASCGGCLNHKWTEWTGTEEATCQGQNQIRTCTKCGETETQFNSDAKGEVHNWGEWKDGGADCEGTLMTRKCQNCKQKEEQLDTTRQEHDFGEWEETGAYYCTGATESKRTCSICDFVETKAEGGNGSHRWSEWEVVEEPTCAEAGLEERACTKSRCEATETREIEPTGEHDFNKKGVCRDCGALESEVSKDEESEENNNNNNNNDDDEDDTNSDTNSGNKPGQGGSIELPDINLDFDFDLSAFDSVAIKVTDASFEVDNYITSFPEYFGVYSITIGEGYLALDDNDKLEGYGKATINTKGTETGVDKNFDAQFYIEDNNIYFDFGGGFMETNSSINMPNHAFKICLDDVIGLVDFESIISEAESAYGDVEAILPDVEDWMNDVFFPILESIELDDIQDFSGSVLSKFIKVEENRNGSTTLSFNYEYVIEIVEASTDASISELVDMLLADGTFEAVEDIILGGDIYELTMVDAINYIETERGLDLQATLDAIDAIIAIVSGDSSMTLVKVLNQYADAGLPDNFDFYEFALDNEYSDYTVMDAIRYAVGGNNTDREIQTQIAGYIAQCRSYTIYDFILPDNQSTNSNIPTPDEIVEYAVSLIDTLYAVSPYSITLAADGTFESVKIFSNSFRFVFDEDNIGPTPVSVATIEVVIDKDFNVVATLGSGELTCSGELEIIPGETVRVNTSAANSLKSKLDSVHVLTQTEIVSLLSNEFSHAYYDSNDNCYYAFRNYSYGVRVCKIIPTTVAVAAFDYCGGPVYSNLFIYSTAWVDYYSMDVDYNYVVNNAYFSDDFEIEAIDFRYQYGSVSSAYVPSQFGHNYTLNYDSYNDNLTCGDIYYHEYTCTNCGDTYRSYNSISHDYRAHYVLLNPYQGINGGVVSKYGCSICGESVNDYYYDNYDGHEISVNSVLGGEVYNFDYGDGFAFSVTIDESTAGYYKFYSTGYYINNVDTYGTIYYLDDWGYTTFITSSDDYDGYDFACFATLEAGKTYVFLSDFELSDYSIFLEKVDVSEYCSMNGHNYENEYKLVDESMGVAGGFTGGRYCTICGNVDEYSSTHNVSITTNLDCEVYDYYGSLAFSVTIDESTAGYYQFYSEGYNINGVDTRGTIYYIDDWGVLSYLTNSDDYNGWDFACFATLEAGRTYVFVTDFEYSDYSLYLSLYI